VLNETSNSTFHKNILKVLEICFTNYIGENIIEDASNLQLNETPKHSFNYNLVKAALSHFSTI